MNKATFLLIGLAALALGCPEKSQAPQAPPEVYVAPVVQQDVPLYMEAVGQTRGSQDVEIRARVEGYLDSVEFTEGTLVRKGQLLYRIDPKPFEAALARAKGDLASWKARLDKAGNDVARYRPLVAQQAVSQQELDNAVSAQQAAQAEMEAAQAAVDKAALDLGYTRITAPLDGLVGTTLVKAGNLVGRGESTLLTTVSQVDPILFRAGISEAEYLRLVRRREELAAAGAAAEPPPIELILADGTVHPSKGSLDAVERAVDAATGTLAVQVKFDNPERVVRPGQYGRARFRTEVLKGALLVPQRAVAELQNLYSVAVVEGDKVAFRNVKVGPRVGNLWVIQEGLKPGDTVVVEGLQRVREGGTVKPTPVAADTAAAGRAE